MLVQDLLHAAEGDGREMPRVLQLQQPLQVHGSLAPPQVNALAVLGIQPQNANRHSSGWENPQETKHSSCFPPNYLVSTDEYSQLNISKFTRFKSNTPALLRQQHNHCFVYYVLF